MIIWKEKVTEITTTKPPTKKLSLLSWNFYWWQNIL